MSKWLSGENKGGVCAGWVGGITAVGLVCGGRSHRGGWASVVGGAMAMGRVSVVGEVTAVSVVTVVGVVTGGCGLSSKWVSCWGEWVSVVGGFQRW